MPNTATPAQIDYINKLKSERDVTTENAAAAVSWAREDWTRGEFTKAKASAMIDWLQTLPRVKHPASEAPEGMHRFNGEIFKVQVAVHGSGHKYAKRLTEHKWCDGHNFNPEFAADDFCNPGCRSEWQFEKVGGAVLHHLSEATLMTLEEAKEFGTTYGVCCVCGATLTDEDSIAAGIGPVCGSKF